MARHLVLGASGFIGRHLARALVASGHIVTGVATRFPAIDDPLWARMEQRRVELFAATPGEISELVGGHDVIHNLVWSTVPATADARPERDIADNVGLMIRLLTALEGGARRLVFVSSGGTVYGARKQADFREDDPLRPIGAYGVSKVAAELYSGVFRARGVDVRIARVSNPYGAGQGTSRLQGAVSRFCASALQGRPIEIWGDGEVVRDYLHVGDTVRALCRIAEADRAALGPEASFNVGGGRGASLNAIVAILRDTVGLPFDVHHRPARPFDVPRNVLDVTRIRERLGWAPAISLRDGIVRTVAELKADPDACLSRGAA